MPPTPPTAGEVIRSHLAEQGITQKSAALAAGMAQQTVSNILSGKRDPSIGTLLQLLGGLGLSLRWLHDRGVRPPPAGGGA